MAGRGGFQGEKGRGKKEEGEVMGKLEAESFAYLPKPEVLWGLSGGQFANRLLRSLRLWVILQRLYGAEFRWIEHLPQPFGYVHLRDRLFAPSHNTDEGLKAEGLTAACRGTGCLCQLSAQVLLSQADLPQSIEEWVVEVEQLSGLSPAVIEEQLTLCPFATVHRSLRDDLKLLSQQGWLKALKQARYEGQIADQWPKIQSPSLSESNSPLDYAALSSTQTWELLHVLESIAFVQPNINVVIDALWQQVTSDRPQTRSGQTPVKRIFPHFDYILSDEAQEQVDTHHQQIEQLWQTPQGGVIQFEIFSARKNRTARVMVYPVCLHYARRAKYLSAYGLDPSGQIAWHNYRLDRIVSSKLRVLPWGDPEVPAALKVLWRTGQLPTPEEVEAKLDEAWGFNFYLPKTLMVLRFSPEFARYYVEDTMRHETFGQIGYEELFQRVRSQVSLAEGQREILDVLAMRPSTDAYYCGWIRLGDINVTMRLRDWRPNGEVIAPWESRLQMIAEAERELEGYGERQK